MAQCWTMTVNGNPAPYNGTFCLVNTGACVFQDKCTNLWTLKVAGGGTTLTSSNGAVYTLSENFNCNGLNSFALAKSPAGSTWQASLTISPTNCNAYPCYPNCTAPPCYALCPNGIAQMLAVDDQRNAAAHSERKFLSRSATGTVLPFLGSMRQRIHAGDHRRNGHAAMGRIGDMVAQRKFDVSVQRVEHFRPDEFADNGAIPAVGDDHPDQLRQSPCSPCPPPPTCVNCNNTGKTSPRAGHLPSVVSAAVLLAALDSIRPTI